jgi:hypothetical protein
VPFGQSYKWCPESVVVVCECGKRATFKMVDLCDSVVACECGADETAGIKEALQNHHTEVLGQLLVDYQKTHHPWLYDTLACAQQQQQDEATYPKDSPWRYNDITSGNANGG